MEPRGRGAAGAASSLAFVLGEPEARLLAVPSLLGRQADRGQSLGKFNVSEHSGKENNTFLLRVWMKAGDMPGSVALGLEIGPLAAAVLPASVMLPDACSCVFTRW